MKVFGYKPEIYKGSYEHFISKTSQKTHFEFLKAEFQHNYTYKEPEKRKRPKVTPTKIGPHGKPISSDSVDLQVEKLRKPNTFHSYWTAAAFKNAFRNAQADEL